MHILANPVQKKLHTNKKKAGKKDRVKYLNRYLTKGSIHVINKYERMLNFISH